MDPWRRVAESEDAVAVEGVVEGVAAAASAEFVDESVAAEAFSVTALMGSSSFGLERASATTLAFPSR